MFPVCSVCHQEDLFLYAKNRVMVVQPHGKPQCPGSGKEPVYICSADERAEQESQRQRNKVLERQVIALMQSTMRYYQRYHRARAARKKLAADMESIVRCAVAQDPGELRQLSVSADVLTRRYVVQHPNISEDILWRLCCDHDATIATIAQRRLAALQEEARSHPRVLIDKEDEIYAAVMTASAERPYVPYCRTCDDTGMVEVPDHIVTGDGPDGPVEIARGRKLVTCPDCGGLPPLDD